MDSAAVSGKPLNSRAYPKNRDVLTNMMETRYQIATLIGYSSWADYNAADKMMGNGANIAKFIAASSMPLPVPWRSASSPCCWRRSGRQIPTATEIIQL